jgi:hypothetical protein
MELLMWHLIINGHMPTWEDLLVYTVALSVIVYLLARFASKPKKRKRK